MHGICRTGAAVGLILALALLRHTGADKIEEHDAPLFHTANHPAVVKVTPSPHKAWLKILAHPTHRHGLCKFDSNTALVHLTNACTVDACTPYPTRYSAEMACANLGPSRCQGVVQAACSANPDLANDCREIHGTGAKADARVFMTFRLGSHLGPERLPVNIVDRHGMKCNDQSKFECHWSAAIQSSYISGCIWDKCRNYDTLAMAQLFCEIHSHVCHGVTHTSSGYQARAAATHHHSDSGETSWSAGCPEIPHRSGSTSMTPLELEFRALQHRAGRPFIPGHHDGAFPHPRPHLVNLRVDDDGELVSDSVIEIKVSLVAATLMISVCGILLVLLFVVLRKRR